MADLDALARIALGFRRDYLGYERVAAQLRAWAEAFPRLCTVRSIGTSVEGRELWVLTIDHEPARRRPAVWIDGNMHAQELCGSSVALAIAEDVLRVHLGEPVHGLAPHVLLQLRDVVFHVLPRMCPDGAETVLTEGRYVRSNPRDRAPHARARWVGRDVDGDGVAMLMRKEDETGELVSSREIPGLLVPRALEDTGPFYKVYPEGFIEPFDGDTIPDPSLFGDNDTDLNRNFPYAWMPEPEQAGAGAYPASEPETRAVVEFANAHPELYAWLNLHTFGGVYIRPLGNQPDTKMDPSDLALFRQIAAWGEEYGGYPTVSGFEEFLYEPDKPLHGDLTDFAFHQRGMVAFVCELWDLFAQVGIERKKPFVSTYTHLGRADLERIARWDAAHNHGRVLRPWRPFEHPQLGHVELGGLDPRVGMVNPPYEMLAEVCAKQSAFFLRVAAMAPAVVITAKPERIAADVTQLTIVVENRGYLPTNVLSSAKKLPWNEPVFLDVATSRCALADPADAHRELGHLAGWGRGLFGAMSASAFFQRTEGSSSTRTVRATVIGHGRVTLRASSPRIGDVLLEVDVLRDRLSRRVAEAVSPPLLPIASPDHRRASPRGLTHASMVILGTPRTRTATKLLLLGSGELGKEVAIEAQRLGVEVVAVDRYPGAPAMQVAHGSHVIDMLDPAALRRVVELEEPDFIVPEIEAIATSELALLEAEGFTVIPTARAARLTMDREGIRRLAAEKLGLATSPYRFADTEEEFRAAIAEIGIPCVIKPVMSSSGKGQSTVRDASEIAAAWAYAQEGGRSGKGRVIVEGLIAFDYEITLLTVRHAGGTLFCEPIGHRQVKGDYWESWQPQPMSDAALAASREIAKTVTDELAGRGLFGVELFVKGDQVWFSEVSPRPHDTGMVTMISQDLPQFSLHVRAILGLPIPVLRQRGPSASFVVLADGTSESPAYEGVDAALAEADTQLRLFGKPEVKGHRRMGVALALGATIEEARAKAKRAAEAIQVRL